MKTKYVKKAFKTFESTVLALDKENNLVKVTFSSQSKNEKTVLKEFAKIHTDLKAIKILENSVAQKVVVRRMTEGDFIIHSDKVEEAEQVEEEIKAKNKKGNK